MALDTGIIDSVTLANVKTFGDTMPTLQSLAISNAVQMTQFAISNVLSHQMNAQKLGEAILAKGVSKILEDSVQEGVAVEKMSSGGLPETLAALLTALGSGQQAVKAAQTTPPVTAAPAAAAVKAS